MFDLSNRKIPVFTDINDVPVAPSATSAGNASHLISQYNALVNEVENALNAICPVSHTHWHDDSVVVTGNGLAVNNDSSRWYQTWWQQSPSTLNDSFEFSVTLRQGTYNLRIHGMSFGDLGTLALDVNTVRAFSDLDMYGGDGINAFYDRVITLPYSGVHEFLFTVIGKNPSAFGYAAPITKFHFRRLGD